jgi:hypothetical protein
MALYMERGRPGDDEFVMTQSWETNTRNRLVAVAKSAKVGPLKVKDLRDT